MFRSEAISFRANRLTGDVAIAVPVSWQAVGFLLSGSLACAMLFLSVASYSRVETVTGAIAPDAGIAPVVATRAGIVAELKELTFAELEMVDGGRRSTSSRLMEASGGFATLSGGAFALGAVPVAAGFMALAATSLMLAAVASEVGD